MLAPLILGRLGGDDLSVTRTRPHWFLSDGAACRRGQTLAICNIGVESRVGPDRHPFAGERTLQVVFASTATGRLRLAEDHNDRSSDPRGPVAWVAGGWRLPWRAGDVLAHVEVDDEDDTPDAGREEPVRLLFLAGQRMGWAVDSDVGPAPTWHARARAWWSAPTAPMKRLLCLGLCEASGMVRGPQAGFFELFQAAHVPLHVSLVSEHPLVPCAPVLIEQLQRGPADIDAVAQDMARAMADGGVTPTPEDGFFTAALLRQLAASPMLARDTCVTPRGLETIGPPEAILLSLAAEPRTLLRHKALGYHVYVLSHDLRAAGPAARAWLKTAFEPVRRSVQDIERDYLRLHALVSAQTAAQLLVINRVSSSVRENVVNYSGFGDALGESLSYVAAKEMNVMLDDLAAAGAARVIDADALAAELGVTRNAPDGIHFSETLEARLRAEILGELGQEASRDGGRAAAA